MSISDLYDSFECFLEMGTSLRWTGRSSKIYKLFSMDKYDKTSLKVFVNMANSKLPTNFQLNIFFQICENVTK